VRKKCSNGGKLRNAMGKTANMRNCAMSQRDVAGEQARDVKMRQKKQNTERRELSIEK
jgi:hypothetical protein